MLRRLLFVLPDVKTARQVEQELLLARIEARHMHFLAKDGLDLGDLPEATAAQKSDLLHGMGIGLIAGGAAGALSGLGAFLYFGAITAQSGLIALFALFGAVFGVFIAGLVGAGMPNTRLRSFADTLAHGHVLLMIDVHLQQIDRVKALIKKHHPDAEDHGIDPLVPAFP